MAAAGTVSSSLSPHWTTRPSGADSPGKSRNMGKHSHLTSASMCIVQVTVLSVSTIHTGRPHTGVGCTLFPVGTKYRFIQQRGCSEGMLNLGQQFHLAQLLNFLWKHGFQDYETVRQGKELAAKSEELSLIPGAHMVEDENQLSNAVLK